MDQRVREFRRLRGGRPGRVGAQARGLAVSYAREAMATGQSVKAVALELRILPETLVKWLPSLAVFRSVEVAPASVASGVLRVRTRSGHEVEGLDVDGAARLLLALEGR